MQGLHVAAQLLQRYELGREGRRAVECLAALPRQPFGDGLPLQVAGREVDAQSHLVVIAVRETFGDALAYAVDAYDQLAFVVHLLREGGDVERVVVAQQRRVGLEEPGRLRRARRAAADLAVELLGVCGVVACYADDFHGVVFRYFQLWSYRCARTSIQTT